MKALHILMAVILALVVSEAARADFSLTGIEHLDVTSHHANGNLSDSSTADVLNGGSVSVLYAHDSSTVDVSGGSVSGMHTYETSTANIVGGSASLAAFHASSVDISGGLVDGLYAYDFSTVDISDGR